MKRDSMIPNLCISFMLPNLCISFMYRNWTMRFLLFFLLSYVFNMTCTMNITHDSKSFHDEIKSQFEAFKIQFHRNYDSTNESTHRLHVFTQNYLHMKQLQEKSNDPEQFGITIHFDLTSEEFGMRKGYKPNLKTVRIDPITGRQEEVLLTEMDHTMRKLAESLPIMHQQLRLFSSSLYNTVLTWSSSMVAGTTLTVGSVWKLSFKYTASLASQVSIYWISNFGQFLFGIGYFVSLSAGNYVGVTLSTSIASFYTANYGLGVLRLVDTNGYYCDWEVNVVYPGYVASTSNTAAPTPPSWSATTPLNWCSTNNPLGKSVCTPIKNQGYAYFFLVLLIQQLWLLLGI